MKIEIGFIEGESGDLETPEPFLSAQQFFLVADILGQLARNSFDERADEGEEEAGTPTGPLGPGAASFLQFISAKLDESEREFEGYCKFVAEANEALAASRGARKQGEEEAAPAGPDPEMFDPRARIFLGRLILAEPEIGPEIARVLLPAAEWIQEALEPSLVALVDKDPDAAAQVQFVSNVFAGLAVFCEEGIAEGRAFGFAF